MFTLLLPPSEGKAPGGNGAPWHSDSGRFRALAADRDAVANALSRVRGGDTKLLGARGELLERAAAANRQLVGSPTMPAWKRFTGVVWEHLDPTGLDADARKRARSAVIVVSAVTGLSGWSDPTPDFRLKLSANLARIGRLDAYWRDRLSPILDERLAGRVVIDLLPNEHRAAWTADPSRYTLLRPVLTKPDGRPGGHDAKATKGRLARALLEAADPETALQTFDAGPLCLRVEEMVQAKGRSSHHG